MLQYAAVSLILTSGHVFCWPCSWNVISIPWEWPLKGWNM